jgi:hypothetical protein
MYCYIEQVTQLLSDRVWAQLDPHAGRLPRRKSLWVIAAAIAAAAVIAAIVPLVHSGVIQPRIHLSMNTRSVSGSSPSPTHPVHWSETYTLSNHGSTTITVIGFGHAGAHLSAPFPPTRIPPGASVKLTVNYRVTECGRVGEFPPSYTATQVRVRRWWGTQTVFVDYPDEVPDIIWTACTG